MTIKGKHDFVKLDWTYIKIPRMICVTNDVLFPVRIADFKPGHLYTTEMLFPCWCFDLFAVSCAYGKLTLLCYGFLFIF